MKMIRNPDLIMRTIAGESLLIPTGKLAQQFNGMVTLNAVAAFIWEHLEAVEKKDAQRPEEVLEAQGELVRLVMEEFEVAEADARKDVDDFLKTLLTKGFAGVAAE